MSDSTRATEATSKRRWLALLLTIVVPGLGHVYLELWKRAFLWFLLYFSATILLPEGAMPESFSVEGVVEASQAVPLHVSVLILGISVLCLVDVYLMVTRHNRRAGGPRGEVATCPNCGKELDQDLDFCHWCTTPLDGVEE